MLAFSPSSPSVAASTDRNWKTSLFGRRKSLPQITKASYIARNSQSSSEDTLCSEYCCDTLMSSPHNGPRHEHFVINEDYDLSSSFGVVDRLDQLAQGIPLGRDQLVISTRLQPDTKLHHPESPQVSWKMFTMIILMCSLSVCMHPCALY